MEEDEKFTTIEAKDEILLRESNVLIITR